MSSTLSPAAALSPEAFYSLYLGGLIVEDERERLERCYTLLALGRLGLGPTELLHLHEGWVDWERGEVHVPARDPCACGECWEHARRRRGRGDGRDLETIVAEECWTPGEGGARRLAFGWSRRLTAVVAGVLDAGSHLERDREAVRDHVEAAATMAHRLNPSDVSVTALRASALTFLASAGFGPRRLADLTATDEGTAGEFARVGGGEVRAHLYRVLADAEPPSLCDGDTAYRLVCDPAALEREPFDPAEYDAAWRRERAGQSDRRERNPRQPSPPPGASFDPDDLLGVREPAGRDGPGLVAESLAEWVDQQERKRGDSAPRPAAGTAETASVEPDAGGRDEGSMQVTEPVAFSVDTRFVAAGFAGGKPTGGSVLLGQEELLFLSREASGIADHLRVDLDRVANVAPGYVPDPLEGLFENTVGVAFHDGAGERRVVVAELPSDARWRFVRAVFARILDGEPAVVTHRPGTPTAVGPHEREMDAAGDRLWLERAAGDDPPIRLRLAQLVDVEHGRVTAGERSEQGLTVTYLRPDGDLVDTELRPTGAASVGVLGKYLTHYDDRQVQRVRGAQLSRAETDILERLYDARGGRDVVGMLEADPDTLSAAMDRLDDLGLVTDGSGGKRLTGVGYRFVSPTFDL